MLFNRRETRITRGCEKAVGLMVDEFDQIRLTPFRDT